MKIGNADLLMTLKKFGVNALIVVLSGTVVVYQDNPLWLTIIPLVKAAINVIKHYS